MPLGMALDILQHVDLHIFTTQAGAVECWPGELTSPKQEVRFLNRTTMKKLNSPEQAMQVTGYYRHYQQGATWHWCAMTEPRQ